MSELEQLFARALEETDQGYQVVRIDLSCLCRFALDGRNLKPISKCPKCVERETHNQGVNHETRNVRNSRHRRSQRSR